MGPEHTSHGRSSAEWFDLLDRYYAGECTTDERAVVERQLATRPGVIRFFRVLRRVLYGSSIGEFDVSAGLQRVKAGVEAEQTPVGQAQETHRRQGGSRATVGHGGILKTQPLRQTVWYTLAGLATAVAIFLVGWNGGVHHTGHAPTSASTYTTARGERANVTLPDGSTVALDVASRLDVPADYMTGNHTVHLIGEALFTVSHRNGTPFAVVAGSTIARVLGTSFMVRHYATDSTATVAVREGRVAVSSTVVAANQLIEVSQNGATRLASVDPSQFSFATGVLTLHRIRLADAIPELNRWYNADIRLGDASLARQEINGKMNAGSLSDLTAILEGALDVHVVRDGRILTLQAR